MTANIDKFASGSGRSVALREFHVRDPRLPLHLRRICGTCEFFDGTLRQAERADCTKLGGKRGAGRDALECREWVRK